MIHSLTRYLEPLEGRYHLAAHPPANALQQEAQFENALLAAEVVAQSYAMASAPLAVQPANSVDTNMLTALSSPDWADLLESSSQPVTSGPSGLGIGLMTSGSVLDGADRVTIDPGAFNLQ